MKTSKVTRELFDKFFNESMLIDKTTEAHEYGVDTISITPHIIIRDFSVESYPSCDREFFAGELDEAWDYFESVGYYSRLIFGNGYIFADYYDDEASQ